MARVFISSTSLDLQEYRDAAIEECNRLGLVPIAMEFFDAMSQGATAGSRRKVDEADLYVGIFAHRYGYIETGQSAGVTELEFDQATQRRLDRLCFLVDPAFPWPEALRDWEHADRLAAFKARIEGQLIRARFTTPEDFQGKLRLALTEWVRGAPDPARPQPPLSLKRLAPTAQNRLRFGARQTLFSGRASEMAVLRAFADDAAPFSWMVVEGPAGAGKSRTVQEFCLGLAPSWRAGFLLPGHRHDAWATWRPEADTAIAVDYAAERVDDLRAMLLALATRADELRGHARVRILLVERSAGGEWMKRLIGSRSDGYAIEAARFPASPLTLGPLSDDALWASVGPLFEQAGTTPPPADQLLGRLREIDPLGRPLFAVLAADAMIAGRNVRDWDRERLMRDVLARERERWQKMGVTPPYEKLLALATLVGDLTEEALQDLPPEVEVPGYEDFDQSIYGVMTGTDLPGEGVAALKPDLLGEFFVLEHVRGRNERVTASKAAALVDLAWKIRGGSTRTDRFNAGVTWVGPSNLPLFLHRLAIEDFGDHEAAPHFLAPPRAAGVDLTFWPSLAAHGIAAHVDHGRLDRAKTLHAELLRIESSPAPPFDTAAAATAAGLSLLGHLAVTGGSEAEEIRRRLRERALAPDASQDVREQYARGAARIVSALHAGSHQALVDGLLADQRELVRLHPTDESVRAAHAVSVAQLVQDNHPLDVRERSFETLRAFVAEFASDVALYPSLAWAARLLGETYARAPDRLAGAERMNGIVRELARRRGQGTLYKVPNIFAGDDMFAWTPVEDDLRRLRLLLAESDLGLIPPFVAAERFQDAEHLLREIHEQWWRHYRQDAEFANLWSAAIVRHADASAAAGRYGQVPKAVTVLQEVAGRFPEQPTLRSYATRLYLNAVKHAVNRGDLDQAAELHTGLQALAATSPTPPSGAADLGEATLALGFAYQEQTRWEPLYALTKATQWAVRSDGLRERLIERGGDKAWTDVLRWLDSVIAAAG